MALTNSFGDDDFSIWGGGIDRENLRIIHFFSFGLRRMIDYGFSSVLLVGGFSDLMMDHAENILGLGRGTCSYMYIDLMCIIHI